MTTNVLIASGTAAVTASTATDCASLGFKSVLPTSTATGHGEDSAYPFANTLDYRDTTVYSPSATNGTTTINFSQSSATPIDYFAFAVHNSFTADMSGMLEVHDGTTWVTVAEFTPVKDDRPFMATFDSIISNQQRLTFTCAQKMYIGAIQIGAATKLKCPSIGFQPGRFSPMDTVVGFQADGNLFNIGRRLNKGFNEKAEFKLLEFSDLDTWYEDFQNHALDSKTLFLKWSKNSDQVMYGRQNVSTMTKPKYRTPYHSDIALDINGYA